MRQKLLFVISLILVTSIQAIRHIDTFYDELVTRLLDEQFDETTLYIPSTDHPDTYPPAQFAQIKGLFPTNINQNICDRLSYLRNSLFYPENNFFTSTWIVHMLWEMRALSITDSISLITNIKINKAMKNTINTLEIFRNQNSNHSNDLSISYWLQQYNESCDYYCAFEDNLNAKYPSDEMQMDVSSLLEAEEVANVSDAEESDVIDYGEIYAANLLNEETGLPADFDDTVVGLALTTLYKENKHGFWRAARKWLDYDFTSNIESMLEDLTKYAYNPLSDDIDNNYIDSRTYYWLRHFVYQSIENGDIGEEGKELMFVPTWQLNHDENEYNFEHSICYQEPYSINNVDPTVGANFIFGITRSLIFFADDRATWFDADIQQIYRNTTNMLLWVTESGWIDKRPELIFLYYPSKHDFFWFVSRTYSVYRNYIINNDLNTDIITQYPFLLDVYHKLESVMKYNVTEELLDNVKTENGTNYYFWDEFLGNDDLDIDGHPDPHYDDRLFSTAMAINALLNIWTDLTISKQDEKYIITQISWAQDKEDTSGLLERVQDTVEGAVLFLREQSFTDKYRFDNAFFGGSSKGDKTQPWFYPMNYFQQKNGTLIDIADVTMSDIVIGFNGGIKGFVNEKEYEEMINQGAIGGAVQHEFSGYNIYGEPWTYWSSHAVTYAAELLAVGKYDMITENTV